MTGIVAFNYAVWTLEYPEFAAIGEPQAQSFFNRATLVCDNTPSSPIQDLFQRTVLLNMATAHIAKLFAMVNGQQANGLVGRISDASEGSVSVSAAYTTPTSDIQAWWDQTSYGAEFWASTQQYRTGFYVPGSAPIYGVGALLPGGPFIVR